MKLILDTVDLESIKKAYAVTEVHGVTSNPTIVSKNAKDGDKPYELIGSCVKFVKGENPEGEFHIQVLSNKAEDIIKEARWLQQEFGKDIFVKIPVTSEGLKAIKVLHKEGVNITATAIYTFMQAFLALNAGADYAALYCNRMLNNGVDFVDVIKKLKTILPEGKILAASFKSIQQVIDAYAAGADACTVQPALLLDTLDSPVVLAAVEAFENDWNRKFN